VDRAVRRHNGQRQCASRRLRDETERRKQRASYLEPATGAATAGGRALPAKIAPRLGTRQRRQLHSLVGRQI
jgi:hypothetical protein